MFLGRPLGFCLKGDAKWDGLLGRFPQAAVDSEVEVISKHIKECNEIATQYRSSQNAEKGYRRTKEKPSKESAEKAKEVDLQTCAIHPIFGADMAEKQVILFITEKMNNNV